MLIKDKKIDLQDWHPLLSEASFSCSLLANTTVHSQGILNGLLYMVFWAKYLSTKHQETFTALSLLCHLQTEFLFPLVSWMPYKAP